MTGLTKFQFSFSAKSEGQRFMELQHKWRQAIVDLEEVGALQSHYNINIIEDIVRKLPGKGPRERYIKLRESLRLTGKSSLEILTAFMD